MREDLMRTAVDMAVDNVRSGMGGPFAALVVTGGRIVGEGRNRVASDNDPTAHAEINAIRSACSALGTFDLSGCEMYATCEPCPMCLGAVYWARLDRLFYAATRRDAKEAGFDDDFIYDELARPIRDRSVEMVRLLEEHADTPFRAWVEFGDRVPY